MFDLKLKTKHSNCVHICLDLCFDGDTTTKATNSGGDGDGNSSVNTDNAIKNGFLCISYTLNTEQFDGFGK